VTDTRKLTGKAAKLYAGAQQTKDGVKAMGARPEHRSDGPGTVSGHVQGAAGSERTWRRPVPLPGMTVADLSDDQLNAIAAAGIGSWKRPHRPGDLGMPRTRSASTAGLTSFAGSAPAKDVITGQSG
jgi:hypothetical protein